MKDEDKDLNDEDAALWEYVTRDDSPMEGKRRTGRMPPEISVEEQTDRAGESDAPIEKDISGISTVSNPKAELPYLSINDQSGIDGNTANKLRRGKIPIEATLDLHGYTQNEAFSALMAFINNAYSAGKRCVLVITGKGTRSADGSSGVLRENLPKWLNSTDIRPKILIYTHAQPHHGGTGAFYILLRRK